MQRSGGGKGKPPRQPGEDEKALWRNHIRDAKPLPERKRRVTKSAVPEKTKPGAKKTQESPALQKAIFPPPAQGHELDRASAERLHRGRMEIDHTLDLHGHTAATAQALLTSCLLREYERGSRLVLVITGKGRPDKEGVLKREVPEWLALPPLAAIILRAVPAQPSHGGSGALYVLLRRKRGGGSMG